MRMARNPAFVETNVVATWAEHLRQRQRQTAESRDLERRVAALLKPGTVPTVTHWVPPEGASGETARNRSRTFDTM